MHCSMVASWLVLFVAASAVSAQWGGIQDCLCDHGDFCQERANGQLMCRRNTGGFYTPLIAGRLVGPTVLRQGLVNRGLSGGLNLGVNRVRVNRGLVNRDLVNQGLFNNRVVNTGLVHKGLVNKGLVNKGLVNTGLVNKGLFNQGIVNKGLVNRRLVNKGLVNKGLVNQGIVNQGIVNQGIVNQGIVNQAVMGQRVVSRGLVGAGLMGVYPVLSDPQCCQNPDLATCRFSNYIGPAKYIGGLTCKKFYFDVDQQMCREIQVYTQCVDDIFPANMFGTKAACIRKCGGVVGY